MVARLSTLLAIAATTAACTGATGTVSITLVTAPGSHVLDAVEKLRLTVTDPHQVVEATRLGNGFDLAVDFDPSSTAGALIVEGFDATGALVACGQSPPFPLAAITAHVAIYVAAPRTFAAAPVALDAARSDVTGAPLSYGAILAGGVDTTGAPSTSIAIYNAFDHSLTAGLPMPGARAGLVVGADTAGIVYLFGGTGPGGALAGTLWRFDTTAAPSGSYTTITDEAGFARADELAITVGAEQYLITGGPPLLLSNGSLTAQAGPSFLYAGAATVPSDGVPVALFAGEPITRFRQGVFDSLAVGATGDDVATTLADGRIVFMGGHGSPLAVEVVDATTSMAMINFSALSVQRFHPSVAATSRYLIVAGGADVNGVPIASADVIDGKTLALITTLPIAAGGRSFAVALPNDQVLLVGGAPASDQIELFTPDPPPP